MLYRLAVNCSAGSSGSCECLLNLAHSIMTFFLTRKNLSNFERTASYCFLWLSEILVDIRISSAFSPKQYNKLLTCHSSDSFDNLATTRYCLNRHFHLGHRSEELNRKGAGGLKEALKVPLTSDTMSYRREQTNDCYNCACVQIHIYTYISVTTITCVCISPVTLHIQVM